MDLQATLAVSFIGRGQARNGEVGPARFGSYKKPLGVGVLPYLPPEQHAKLPASAAVIAVTSCSLSTPSFFGQIAWPETNHCQFDILQFRHS
jgi:hypothetical protein